MKKTLLLPLLLLIGFFTSATAQTTETTFPVSGNCSMCKKRIETALDVKGVQEAVWNVDTKKVTIKYKASKISEDELKKLIASAGYDTPGYTADSAAYKKLPDCCQYRTPGKHSHWK